MDLYSSIGLNFKMGDELHENEPQHEASEPDRKPQPSVPAPPAGQYSGQYPDQAPVGPAAPPPGQWVYVQATPPKPAASGLRIAAGILLFLLGFVELMSLNWFVMLSLLGFAPIATGIVLLCQTRSRKPGTPRIGMWLASFAVVMGLFAWLPFNPDRVTGMLFLSVAIPILVLLNKDWDRDKKPAQAPAAEQAHN